MKTYKVIQSQLGYGRREVTLQADRFSAEHGEVHFYPTSDNPTTNAQHSHYFNGVLSVEEVVNDSQDASSSAPAAD